MRICQLRGVGMKKLSLISLVSVLLSLGLTQSGCAKASKESNTITVWHWMTDRHDAFVKLAEKYEQQTGINVKFDLYAPSEAYSQKIIAAAQARVLPDIYGILGEKKILASFIESGYVADLTAEFKKDDAIWENSLFPKALAVNTFAENNSYQIKPGIYGVPIDVTNIQMIYNQKLLKKAGVERAPVNFNEFLKSIEALNRIGIAGLVSGWGEMWMIDCFASNYAFNIMGEEKVMATFKGEVPYTDPDWIKVLNIFKTLADRKALMEGIVTKGNKYAEQDFALERAAFAFNGSWCVNVYQDMNPNLEYGAMLPPAVNPDLSMKIWGGAGSSFVVNVQSLNKAKTIKFLRWLTEKDQQVFLTEATRNLPSNRQALSAISKVLSQFAGAMDFTTHPTTWELNEQSSVIEAFDKGIQSIIIGEKTPEQVAQDVQKVKERELKKAKSR